MNKDLKRTITKMIDNKIEDGEYYFGDTCVKICHTCDAARLSDYKPSEIIEACNKLSNSSTEITEDEVYIILTGGIYESFIYENKTICLSVPSDGDI